MSFGSFEEIYAKDESKSESGVPMDIGFNKKGEPIVFIVAEMGNSKNERSMRRYEKALESARRDKTRRRMVWAKILSESILMDWSGVLDNDGNPVPATLQNKIAAFEKYEKLFTDVMEFSQNPENYRPDDKQDDPAEESEKNLKSGSGGTPVTPVS
jgi:uncharacterized protein (UPF0371 family)